MKFLAIFLAVFVTQVFGSILNIFDQGSEHEPRVAIYCGHVAFHIDLETGKWISDTETTAQCDTNKEDVKRYCQKTYPKLNISNIVESNEKAVFRNWCKVGSKECNVEKKVVPYRCLVDDYEADALMVPNGCKFNHLHDEASCMTHDEWKGRAKAFCRKDDLKLNEYGILLSCGTDMFTGVEFVCCPREHKHKKDKRIKHKKALVDRTALEAAVKEVEKFLPPLSQGCDRTVYEKKRQRLEENHQSKIAAVVDEWDEAEAHYKKIKTTNLSKAQERMRSILKVFRETLAALEEKAKEERTRLKTEHAKCIQTNINKQKRDSMLAYLLAVQEKPHTIKNVIKAARKFFKVCEHDRLHRLRHFQHVRKQQPESAEKLHKELLVNLQQLNDVVNKSLALLSHFPDFAENFGFSSMFEPSPVIPEIIATTPATEKPIAEKNSHKTIPERILKMINKLKEDEKKQEELENLRKFEPAVPESVPLVEEALPSAMPTEGLPQSGFKEEEQSVGWPFYEKVEPTVAPAEEGTTTTAPVTAEKQEEELETTPVKMPENSAEEEKEEGRPEKKKDVDVTENETDMIDNGGLVPDKMQPDDEENSSKKRLSKGTLNPTDAPPKTKFDNEGLPEVENPRGKQAKQKHHHHKHSFFKEPRSPAAFAAVIGLSCGALVIMLGIIVALVMRRNRAAQARVYIPEAEPEDREHLVKMQKSGYENPTYKFFYY